MREVLRASIRMNTDSINVESEFQIAIGSITSTTVAPKQICNLVDDINCIVGALRTYLFLFSITGRLFLLLMD